MIKQDIAAKLAPILNIKEYQAVAVVDVIVESIREVVSETGRLELRGFGVFQVKERKPRIGRNPKTKVEYPIPRRRVVTFKAGKDIKVV